MTPNPQLSFVALERARHQTESRNQQRIRELVPLAIELARKAGREGITVANLRQAAQLEVQDREHQRAYSWLGAVLKRAGLIHTSERRMTAEARTRNRNDVWVHPDFRMAR